MEVYLDSGEHTEVSESSESQTIRAVWPIFILLSGYRMKNHIAEEQLYYEI